MPAKRDPLTIDPASVIDVRGALVEEGGAVTVNLVAPGVPVELVDSVGRAFALAVGKATGLDDAAAEILAGRVVDHLRREAFEALREDYPGPEPRRAAPGPDDDLPF